MYFVVQQKSSVSFCSWIILRFLLLPSQPAASLTLSCLFLVPLQCVNKWSLFNSVSLWSVLVLRQWTFLFGSSSTLHQLNKRCALTFCNCLSDPELNSLNQDCLSFNKVVKGEKHQNFISCCLLIIIYQCFDVLFSMWYLSLNKVVYSRILMAAGSWIIKQLCKRAFSRGKVHSLQLWCNYNYN